MKNDDVIEETVKSLARSKVVREHMQEALKDE
jgi:hypothetical protein